VSRLVALVILTASAAAWACPTCTCGNPAMTAMGAEQPFANRVRVALTTRAWQQSQGRDGVDLVRLREVRVDLTGSWSPTPWFALSVNVPVQLREQRDVSLAREVGLSPGEVDVAARFVVYGHDRMRPPALVSVIAGARLPTAPTLVDRQGQPLSLDAQPGAGGLAPQLGVSWSGFFGDRWSAMASVLGEVPLQGRFGFHLGPSAVIVSLAQFQPARWFAVRAGLDVRLEGLSFLNGEPDASLSGFLGSALADVVFGLGNRVLLLLGARVPVVDLRVGPVRTLPIAVASVLVELSP
jgi:hypothetical protein